MAYVLHALVPTLWILWLAYWIVAARTTHETRRREGRASRLSHYGPLILGGLLLGVPNILGAELDRPFHAATPFWLLLAVALVVPGLGFSALARAYLGRNWSVEVTIKNQHELVRSGPYAVVRHPMYAGAIFYFLGTPLLLGSWYGLAFAPAFIALLAVRAVMEERMLTRALEGYPAYAARVRYRLVPFVW